MVSESASIMLVVLRTFLSMYTLSRAKAKLQGGKRPSVTEVSELSPDTPPELSAGFEAELYSLIHEDGREHPFHFFKGLDSTSLSTLF